MKRTTQIVTSWLVFSAVGFLLSIYFWIEFIKLCVWIGQYTWP
jgi:hypothetical protein